SISVTAEATSLQLIANAIVSGGCAACGGRLGFGFLRFFSSNNGFFWLWLCGAWAAWRWNFFFRHHHLHFRQHGIKIKAGAAVFVGFVFVGLLGWRSVFHLCRCCGLTLCFGKVSNAAHRQTNS